MNLFESALEQIHSVKQQARVCFNYFKACPLESTKFSFFWPNWYILMDNFVKTSTMNRKVSASINVSKHWCMQGGAPTLLGSKFFLNHALLGKLDSIKN